MGNEKHSEVFSETSLRFYKDETVVRPLAQYGDVIQRAKGIESTHSIQRAASLLHKLECQISSYRRKKMKRSAYHPFRSAKAREKYLALYNRQAQQWPVPSETRMVETSYGQTFVRISGAADAQPLVLLPGASVSSLMWVPHIEAFSACYRTYAVDNIYDVGRSVYTRHLKTSHDFVSWLDELFTALGLDDQIFLMGVSFGGWQACHYAVRFPDRLAKVVLVAPAGTVLPMRLEFFVRGMLGTLHRSLFRSLIFWMFEDFVRKGEASQKLAEDFVDDALLALHSFKLKFGVVPTVLLDRDLQGLQVPTLYIVGEHEKIYSPDKAIQRLHAVAPQIKTALIPGAGHDLLVLQTELINRIVLEFLQQPTRHETPL